MLGARTLLFTTLAALGGWLLLGGEAAATEPVPLPPQAPNPANPPDDMPWMKYSPATLERQGEYNDWAPTHGWPTIEEDGILGPASCDAFTNWQIEGGPAVPSACSNVARYKICRQAAAVRAEYLVLEARITSGAAFSGDEEHLQDLYNELSKLERLCGDIVLTGTGTRE